MSVANAISASLWVPVFGAGVAVAGSAIVLDFIELIDPERGADEQAARAREVAMTTVIAAVARIFDIRVFRSGELDDFGVVAEPQRVAKSSSADGKNVEVRWRIDLQCGDRGRPASGWATRRSQEVADGRSCVEEEA